MELVETFLPVRTELNRSLSSEFPDWDVNRTSDKIGIEERRVSSPNEFSSTLAIGALTNLFKLGALLPEQVDYLILVTQSPDYFLPTTATLVHHAIGLREDCGAIDMNLGCSGYVAALGFAKGMIESGQASNIVLATSDTYTKFINPSDRTVRTIFGDGATATWISDKGSPNSVGNVLVGNDGSGAGHLVVPTGGLRSGDDINPKSAVSERGLEASGFDLFMDGREIFNFTLRISEGFLKRLLDRSGLKIGDVDHFIFHQANAFMLNHLREKLGLPEEKVPILMSDFGNTVSGTIPMVLDKMIDSGKIIPGQKLVLFGFGVGLSWSGVVVET